jgi:hypothetical protein
MNKVRLCGKRCLLSSITHWMIDNTTFLFSNMKTMHGIDIRNKFNIVHRTLAYTIMIKVILCGLHFARLHLSWPSQRFGFWGRVVFWGRCMPFAIFEFGAPRQHSRAKIRYAARARRDDAATTKSALQKDCCNQHPALSFTGRTHSSLISKA